MPSHKTKVALALLPILIGASAALASTAAEPPAKPAVKIKITKLADLPPRTYTIQGKASELVENQDGILTLATAVVNDIKADLDAYDIQDATTLRRLYGTLADTAMLRKDYKTARAMVIKVRELQEKPAERLTSGVVTESMITAFENPGEDFHKSLRANLKKTLEPLPFQEIQPYLKSTKATFEILSKNLVLGSIASQIDPAAASGSLSRDFASQLIQSASLIRNAIPNKDDVIGIYSDLLDANKVAKKPDIWKDRDAPLDKDQKLTPVVVGIWDSGTDVGIFKGKLWVNSGEVPGNGKDDDSDGFVDDVNGIAWTLHSDPTRELLVPASELGPDAGKYKSDMKGLVDLQANVDSAESTALKKKLSELPKEQVKPFLEGLTLYSQYAHGTHVTGIAANGNPAARILVSRITFDHHLVPEKPSIEQAQKDAAAMVKTVAYLKDHGARVVNMSWGGDLKSIDEALEQNNAGGAAEERRALAKKIYDIGYKALHDAIQSTPDTLFVIAAGNSNNDVKFDDVFPSSFQLSNVLVAGAVDQAGEQTSFTSFGNVDVFANGFEVESYIPGGDRMNLSGTSMAAPNVTNLAAKLWAVNPKLSVSEVKSLIVKGSEERKAGDKTIRLIDPKKTLALASARG